MGQQGSRLASSKGAPDEGGADDVKRQVDGGGEQQKRIYELVDVKTGGGLLIDIIRRNSKFLGSSSSGNSAQEPKLEDQMDAAMDKQIYDLVEPLLYNNGKGKLIPLNQIWSLRYGKLKADSSQMEYNNKRASGRLVCWKLEERGFVGETALHICFLLSTQSHMLLAQKLLKFFPLLVNDIYTCDQYFGESSLHMAIVNENVRIVKLLVDHGADVHERCLGSFFLPTDQKDRTNIAIKKSLTDKKQNKLDSQANRKADTLAHSGSSVLDLQANCFTSPITNYQGYVYWGEYPLSFAACLGLSDCYKLLLAKNADPNRKDSNGNTTLHMTVIADRLDMFDLCYSNGANLSMTNNQNLSPLSLAARLKRVQMFFHILNIHRRISWIFCSVAFIEVPLAGIDSINERGECDEDSVLSIVVFENSNEHLEMLNGFLDELLKAKWVTSVRRKFLWLLAQFIVVIGMSCVAYFTRFVQQTHPTDYIHKANLFSELYLVFYSLGYLLVSVGRLLPDFQLQSLHKLMAHAPEVSLFMLTCFMVLLCVPLRLAGLGAIENLMASMIMFALPLKLLFFCRASESVGSFVVMIYKILKDDVLCFVVFLVIFVAGFSSSFFIIFKTHRSINKQETGAQPSNTTLEVALDNNYFSNLFDGVTSMHMMALNEFGVVYDEMDSTDYPSLAKTLFLFYMVLVSILLMNMLIAMLGKTYQDISSQPNENLRQWARALLTVERLCSPRDRLRMSHRYSHEKSNCTARFYRSTWTLEDKDLNNIDALKKLNAENRKNSARLEAVKCKKVPNIINNNKAVYISNLSDDSQSKLN